MSDSKAAITCPACGGDSFPQKSVDDHTRGCQECGHEWPVNKETNMPEFPRMPDADVRTIARFIDVDEDVVYAVLTLHRYFLTNRVTPDDGSEIGALRQIVAVLFQNSHRTDADYFLTDDQRALAQRVSAEIGEVEVRP